MSRGNPVDILELRPNGFTFKAEPLLAVLDKVGERPVAIYSINGPAGTGKSFLLNYFLRFLLVNGEPGWASVILKKHFSWRGGSGRNTKGILIWSEPFIIKRANDGKEVGIILIDTQGSFDQDATMQDNAIIFAFSTLISSVMIFNTQIQGRDIGEDKLLFLQFFAGYARLMDEKNDNEPFQKLVFLIRDYEMKDYKHGFYDNIVTATPGKNFKIDMLDSKETQPEEVQIVHKNILKNFNSVGCYLMPHPGKELLRTDNPSKMDDDFAEHLRLFTKLMLDSNNLVTKVIGKGEMTGIQIKKFVNVWAKKFNDSKLPDVIFLYDSKLKIHDNIAKKGAIDYFNTRIEEMLNSYPHGMNQYQFDERFKEIEKSSIDVLTKLNPMGGKDSMDDMVKELKDYIERPRKWFQKENENKVKIHKQGVLDAEKVALIEKSFDNNRKRLAEISHKNHLFVWEEKKRIVDQMEEYKQQMEELLKQLKIESSQKNYQISKLKTEIDQIRRSKGKSHCIIS